MKKLRIAVVVALVTVVAWIYGYIRLRSEFAQAPQATDDPGPKSHKATRAMIEAGDQSTGQVAPDFEADAHDGGTYKLSELLKDGPTVLIFIKDDCPCSTAADPFLQRVHAAGRGFVRFYGVIDGGVMVAQRWADRNGNTVFPILADPDRKIITAYNVPNSAYVAFINPDGRIEKLWAGYSEEMLKELGGLMARYVKPGMEPYDVADAPRELYSGCPF